MLLCGDLSVFADGVATLEHTWLLPCQGNKSLNVPWPEGFTCSRDRHVQALSQLLFAAHNTNGQGKLEDVAVAVDGMVFNICHGPCGLEPKSLFHPSGARLIVQSKKSWGKGNNYH